MNSKWINRLFIAVVLAGLSTGHAGMVFAADSAQEQAAKIEAKKKELNGHEWEVKMTSSADKTKSSTDTLIFRDMKFESKNMTSQGYNITNYTISLQEGGPSVWETMQSNEKGNAVFWRAEWEGEAMHGLMSKQVGEGKNDDYFFSSINSKEIPAETPKPVEEAPAPAAVEAPAVNAPAVEAPKADLPEQASEVAKEAVAEAGSKAAEVKAAVPPAPPAAAEKPKKKKGWF